MPQAPQSDDVLARLFLTEIPVDEAQIRAIENIGEGLYQAALLIVDNTPPSADRTLALQHLVDAKHRAVSAIRHKGERLIPMS